MLMRFEEAERLISEGNPLHIAGAETLLKKLPRGNWIGGSTEYFMTRDGGKVTATEVFVEKLPYPDCRIAAYDAASIGNVTLDAFGNGFSIVIIPFDSPVHKEYAENAAGFPEMFIKNIVGWISGVNLNAPGQTPVAVDGATGEIHHDKAVAIHMNAPAGHMVNIGIINIFSADTSSPVLEFPETGFSAEKCLVDGKETAFADYLSANRIDTKLPLVGSYSGVGVNTSFKSVENGRVNFYAPVFPGIQYQIANPVADYEKKFAERLEEFKGFESVFSCNCILNFLYGELEGKELDAFFGPITFGEIAYQLVNQTLVYVTVAR